MTRPNLEIPTRVARAGWDEHWYFGQKVFGEIAGNMGLPRLLALTVGVELTAAEARLIEVIAEVSTAADPRVPPLLLGRIVASEGRALSGICAGWLSCDDGRLGPWVSAHAATMLIALSEDDPDGDDEILGARLAARKKSGSAMPGFGAPFREKDERVEPFLRTVNLKGHTGTYWSLAQRCCALAPRHVGLPANIALPCAGLLLDLGLEGDRLAITIALMLLHTFVANALEGAEQQSEILRCLPSEYIEYVGVGPR